MVYPSLEKDFLSLSEKLMFNKVRTKMRSLTCIENVQPKARISFASLR